MKLVTAVIQPHRLEMGTKLATRRGRDLYAFWGDRIAGRLDADLQGQAEAKIVNLASEEYFGAVDRKALKAPVIDVRFEEEKDGERRSTGGILIPATAQISKRLVWAGVVALGQNVRSAEVGDRVLFSPEDRYEVEVGGTDYIMLRERDIHAVAASRIEQHTGLYL